MEKLDLSKTYKRYFTAKAKPEIVEIEPAQFISIPGKGDPSAKAFSEKVQALYATAYAIKFMYKSLGNDFIVSKLEGIWWYDETVFNAYPIADAPINVPRNEWEYRLLIRMPDYVVKQEMKRSVEIVMAKKNLPLAKSIEWFAMSEGKSVQMLHVGPFSTEPETLREMDTFMKANGLTKNGRHHEIYLSDFNKTEPGKLKTILREPVK